MNENLKNRLKNPYFWLGLGGVIFSAAGVDFNTLTSWSLLGQAFLNILANPVAVVAVAAALIGVVVDPSTKGLKDNK
ncbi:phage holin [Clostridium perfringens]|uniref:Phage holin n=1 Tax=Clostridium perfringens TaxID=1502 RepID=A0A2X3INK3_CLOPF|nr:phage holin [Clostridium perfringens]EGT4136678.1 phage holin [Clostridium perfringens]MBI6054526.1 phage holin [Clostridium perfringens]MBO3417925.1 phage holin [Clostridium perfringens]NGT56784.1 phage holin [Clostridium perfringens]NGT68177.1 phage holin [Clostridium perfringens]